MKKITYVLFAAVIVCLILNAHNSWSQKVQQTINAEFSSPDKPGKIKLSWMLGNVTVKVYKEPGVSIQLLRKAEPAEKEGLTLIKSSKTTFSLPIEAFEEDNVITIRTFSSDGYYDILLLVPPPTSLQINNTSGDIIVEDLTGRMGEIDAEERFMRRIPREEIEDIVGGMGEIDVKCDHGDILLYGITGPVTANSQYGIITAEFTAINHDKPMSFATVNKDITLLLPPDTKATLSLNTKGYIATNMDLKAYSEKEEELYPLTTTLPLNYYNVKTNLKNVEYPDLLKGFVYPLFPTNIIKDTYFQIKLDTLKYEKFKLGEFKVDEFKYDKFKLGEFKYEKFKVDEFKYDISVNYSSIANLKDVRRKNALSTYTINDGGVRITVSSSFGNIYIKKRI